jgi:hypothetical protein
MIQIVTCLRVSGFVALALATIVVGFIMWGDF